MRPTFMGFETAKSAIFANQKSLDIVGNNLANIDTNGYTRQRIERVSVAQSSFTTRVTSNRTGLAGQGVDISGVSQMRDSFLDKCFRDEYAYSSYHGQAVEILSSIQSALVDGKDITSDSGLQGAIESIYTNLNSYIKEPSLDSSANLVMSSFKNITQILNQLSQKLDLVAEQQTSDMQINVNRTNELIDNIAHINEMMSKDSTVLTNPENQHYRPNDLLDQRNLLIDELSAYGDIKVTDCSDGTVNIEMGGTSIVQGTQVNTLTMTTSTSGRVSLNWRSTGEKAKLNGGSLLASVQYINGRGGNVQSSDEEPQQGIPYYKDRLDTFANALASVVNNTVPEYDAATKQPKTDENGNIIYKKLLASKDFDGISDSGASIKASNICISSDWTQGGAGYFIYSRDEYVEDYAQKLATVLMDEKHSFQTYGEGFSGSFSDYVIDYSGKLGSDVKFQQNRQTATGIIADDYLSQRDEVSGVSKDEETADMLKYQKSYEAAARLMTVLDDVLDVLINKMGRVGL